MSVRSDSLDFRSADIALKKLAEISDARWAFKQAAEAAVANRYGVQGMSDNSRFIDNVMGLFDAHVDHLVRREQSRMEAAIFPSQPTGEKDTGS